MEIPRGKRTRSSALTVSGHHSTPSTATPSSTAVKSEAPSTASTVTASLWLLGVASVGLMVVSS